MAERNSRTTLQGVVTSVKNAKTIVVTVSTERNHPLYNKRVGYSKKFHAHDENGIAQLGDVVTIMACRPLSATKRFRLVSVDKKKENILAAAQAEETLEAKEGSEVVTKEAE
jgi:small subunit ribosomal protein S17